MNFRVRPTLPLAAVIAAGAAGWLIAQAPAVTTGGSTFFAREAGRNRTRFHGDVSQHPDGRIRFTKFRMDTLTEREEPEMHIEAPECLYEIKSNSASSAGPLKVSRADGLFSIEGEGFHWDQKETRLVISNRVRAVIRRNLFSGTNSLPSPPSK